MSPSVQNRRIGITLVALPVLFAALAGLQSQIDAQTRASHPDELLLRSGPLVKKLSLGCDALLADVYWTRAVQYYGTQVRTSPPRFESLWPLLDVATTLDSHLIVAYHFGAIFLSEPPPAGAGRTDLAVELVKRGVAANPNEWGLSGDLGFLYYWHLKDYRDSAAAYLQGSKIPGAPIWLGLMAARVAEKGGSFDTSRMIWTQIYESTRDPHVRKEALKELRSLRVQEDEEQLNQLAEEFHKRFGRHPVSTKEMFEAGLLRGIPADPAGYPYVLAPDGKAQLDSRSPVVVLSPLKNPPR